MSELLPCPFCGGEAEYGLTVAGEEVYCTKCKAAMPRTTTKEQAIEAWNTRSDRALNKAAGKWAKADAELRALKEEQFKLEQLCKKRLERIERLEKLCSKMFRLLEMSAKFPATVSGIEPTRREMQALGLLEVVE